MAMKIKARFKDPRALVTLFLVISFSMGCTDPGAESDKVKFDTVDVSKLKRVDMKSFSAFEIALPDGWKSNGIAKLEHTTGNVVRIAVLKEDKDSEQYRVDIKAEEELITDPPSYVTRSRRVSSKRFKGVNLSYPAKDSKTGRETKEEFFLRGEGHMITIAAYHPVGSEESKIRSIELIRTALESIKFKGE
jgi:hypothetical protein